MIFDGCAKGITAIGNSIVLSCGDTWSYIVLFLYALICRLILFAPRKVTTTTTIIITNSNNNNNNNGDKYPTMFSNQLIAIHVVVVLVVVVTVMTVMA
jgi:hypothetical protein